MNRLQKGVAGLAVAAALMAAPFAAAQAQQAKRLPDVPFVPTSARVVEGMLKLAGVKAGDVVYDLGCGDGRIVIAAARDFGARGVGIDINPVRIHEARENAAKDGVAERAHFEEGDFFQADIHDASVVTLYLLTDVNRKLKPKLFAELKPGTRVVSNTFGFDDWTPQQEVVVDGRKLMLYIVPERKK